MTDEERKKLCAQLRYMHNEWYCDHCDLEPCETAADEIERLANRVAELEAMPPDNARWAIHDNHRTFK